MKKLAIPALLCATSLAACGGESTVLEPGQWDMNLAVTKIEAPGLPQGANVPLPPPQTVSQCLTPEQARNPGADFAGGGPCMLIRGGAAGSRAAALRTTTEWSTAASAERFSAISRARPCARRSAAATPTTPWT